MTSIENRDNTKQPAAILVLPVLYTKGQEKSDLLIQVTA